MEEAKQRMKREPAAFQIGALCGGGSEQDGDGELGQGGYGRDGPESQRG